MELPQRERRAGVAGAADEAGNLDVDLDAENPEADPMGDCLELDPEALGSLAKDKLGDRLKNAAQNFKTAHRELEDRIEEYKTVHLKKIHTYTH